MSNFKEGNELMNFNQNSDLDGTDIIQINEECQISEFKEKQDMNEIHQ